MKIEYEATFPNIEKDAVRERLQHAGAAIVQREFMQKRVVFHLPPGQEPSGAWARVRDEGSRITMSVKMVQGAAIQDQKEACVVISSFEEGASILKALGCKEKAYQESKREIWRLGKAEITLDEWPFLEPLCEIEAESEREVRDVAENLGFDWKQAKFGAVDLLYSEKYGISQNVINDATPRIVFAMKNPFV